MGYEDRFYYGMAKLIVESKSSTVKVKSGTKEWTKDVVGGKAEFFLPGTNQYRVEAGNFATDVELSYGEYKTIKGDE